MNRLKHLLPCFIKFFFSCFLCGLKKLPHGVAWRSFDGRSKYLILYFYSKWCIQLLFKNMRRVYVGLLYNRTRLKTAIIYSDRYTRLLYSSVPMLPRPAFLWPFVRVGSQIEMVLSNDRKSFFLHSLSNFINAEKNANKRGYQGWENPMPEREIKINK